MRAVGVTAIVLCVVALLATIWVDGYRWQMGLTAGLLLVVGAAILGTEDKDGGAKHD